MHQQDPRTRNRGKKRKAAEDISDSSDKVDDNIFEPGKRTEVIFTIVIFHCLWVKITKWVNLSLKKVTG